MKKNIISKIQKLLSLANSSNENEAKTAMNMANRLLLKHNLSIQQIDQYKFEYEFKNVGTDSFALKLHQKLVANLVKDYFFVEVLILKQIISTNIRAKYQKTIQLVGTKENCEIASYIFSYLDHAYPELWQAYYKKNSIIKPHKESYYMGLTQGIKSMLEKTKLKVQEETGLVLQKDINLTKFIKEKSKGTYGSKSARLEMNQKVYNDGISQGSNIALHKPIKSDCGDDELMELLK